MVIASINPKQTEMEQVIETVLTPAHTNAFETLLDEPLAGTFHHATAERKTKCLELGVVNMLAVSIKIEVKIGQSFVR